MPTKIAFFDAATAGHNTDSRFNQTQHRIAMDDQFIAMRQHFEAAANSQARRRADNRHRRIFKIFDGHLKAP